MEQKKYKPFFSLFNNSSKENILLAVSLLPKKYILLLQKKYGEDLLNTSYNPLLTKDENRIIRQNITKIIKRNIIKIESGNYIIIGIDSLFEENTPFEEISQIVNFLPKTYKQRIISMFEEDLNKKEILTEEEFNNLLNSDLKKSINRYIYKEKHIKSTFKTFIKFIEPMRLLNERDEELIKRARTTFINLTSEELNILYLRFGENLQEVNKTTSKNNNILRRNVIPKIKNHMNRNLKTNIYCKSLLETCFLSNYIEILEIIMTLSEKEQTYLKIKYSDNYLGTVEIEKIPPAINKKINNIVKKIQRIIIKRRHIETKISMIVLNKISYIIKSREYSRLKYTLGENLALAIMLKKYFSNKCTTEQIAILTKTEPIDVINITKEYLQLEKECLNLNSLKRFLI